MAEFNDIVKLAVDGYNGRVQKYSVEDSQQLVREALIKANNGSTKLNYRDIRDGKCNGLFSLVEIILKNTVMTGLQEDDFFNSLVDYRNVEEGDEAVFQVEDSNLFIVDDTADGTQGVRRQRLGGKRSVTIPTSMKTVLIYEELNRVLSGRVDFNEMIDNVANSFRQKILNDVYMLWANATAEDIGGEAFFPVAGSYNEDALLDTIAQVEAAAGGKKATIAGTKKALRHLAGSMTSDGAKEDIYNMGYCGKFYGTSVIDLPQRYKMGTKELVFDDETLTIIAGDQKPIKFVYEGDPLIIMGDPSHNADLTQEYFYGEKYGMGMVMAGGNAGVGKYKITK